MLSIAVQVESLELDWALVEPNQDQQSTQVRITPIVPSSVECCVVLGTIAVLDLETQASYVSESMGLDLNQV